MTKLIPALLLILPVLAASGCTTTIPTSPGLGVVIEEFSTGGLTEFYPGEEVTFFLKIRNQGTAPATEVKAELLGFDEDWFASSSQGNQVAGTEILPQEAGCQYTGSGSILRPADLSIGTPGEIMTCTWKYNVPEIPPGLKPTYQATARVFYNYETTVVKSFTVLKTDELMKYNQQGRAVPSSTVSTTGGPVSISIEARDPVRFGGSVASFPVALTVRNVGGGMACLEGKCKKATGDSAWNKVTLNLDSISQGLSHTDSSCSDKELDVWPNRENTVVCDIDIQDVNQIVSYEERLMKITATYGYFADKTVPVTVL